MLHEHHLTSLLVSARWWGLLERWVEEVFLIAFISVCFCVCMQGQNMWVGACGSQKENIRSLGLGVAGYCNMMWVLGNSSDSLEEQQAFVSTEPSLQPQDLFYFYYVWMEVVCVHACVRV